LQYPVSFPSRQSRDAIASYLLEQGIDTIKYLDDIVDIASKAYGYTGGCSVSEQLSKRVLIVPNYHGLRQRDVQHITECLNGKWAQVSGHGQGPSATVCTSEAGDVRGDVSYDGQLLTSMARGHDVEVSEEAR